MSGIDKKQVEEFFTIAAFKHKNENAVLDVANGQEHSNVYRNYFTANYILKNLAPKNEQTILDFGCGVGRITKMLAYKSLKIIGVDSNVLMIKTAKQKFNSNNNIVYHLLEEEKINFEDNYFDKAFSNWVFQHIDDEELILWLKK